MMMRNDSRRFPLGLKAALLLGLAFCMTSVLGASDGLERVWSRQFPLPAGGQVSVENVHGNVSVEGWDRSEVEAVVVMTTSGSGEHLYDVKVAVETTGGALAFHTLYPQSLDEPVRVDYRLRVPRQVNLRQLSTLEGNISVRDVAGSVAARSLHGDIDGEDVAGAVEARALTGNVTVHLSALPESSAPLVLETVNGNVQLLLPPHPNADLELKTVAGRIEGAYIFQASAVPGDSTRHARLGHGGVQVMLRTVRGNIRVGEREDVL